MSSIIGQLQKDWICGSVRMNEWMTLQTNEKMTNPAAPFCACCHLPNRAAAFLSCFCRPTHLHLLHFLLPFLPSISYPLHKRHPLHPWWVFSRILSPLQLKNRFGFVFSPLLHVHFKLFLNHFWLFVWLIDWLIVCLFVFAVNEVWFCAFLGLWLCLMIAGKSLVSWYLWFSFSLFRVSSCCRCWCFSLAITLCCWFVCFSSANLPVSSFLKLVWVLDLWNSWWFHLRAGMSLVF